MNDRNEMEVGDGQDERVADKQREKPAGLKGQWGGAEQEDEGRGGMDAASRLRTDR